MKQRIDEVIKWRDSTIAINKRTQLLLFLMIVFTDGSSWNHSLLFCNVSWAVVAEQSLKEGELNKLQNREMTSLQKSTGDKRA